jgi:hypothetical protein
MHYKRLVTTTYLSAQADQMPCAFSGSTGEDMIRRLAEETKEYEAIQTLVAHLKTIVSDILKNPHSRIMRATSFGSSIQTLVDEVRSWPICKDGYYCGLPEPIVSDAETHRRRNLDRTNEHVIMGFIDMRNRVRGPQGLLLNFRERTLELSALGIIYFESDKYCDFAKLMTAWKTYTTLLATKK